MADDAYDDRKYGTDPIIWTEADSPEELLVNEEGGLSSSVAAFMLLPLAFVLGILFAVGVWPGIDHKDRVIPGSRQCYYYVHEGSGYKQVYPYNTSSGACV